MPAAAVAVPAAIAIAGKVKEHIDRKNDQKRADQAAQKQQSQNDQAYQEFTSKDRQYTPEELQQFLSTGPGGQQVGAYKGVGAWNAPDVGRYQNTNWGEVAKMQARTPAEAAALAKILQTGQQSQGQAEELNQVSMPQLQAVSQRNLALLGGNKGAATQAIAPQAEQIAEIQRGAQRGLAANSALRGGARGQAMAESARLAAGQISGLIPAAQQQAMQSAAQLGTSGQQLRQSALGQAGALFNQAQSAEAQNRQFGIGAEQANRQIGGQLELGASGQALQDVLGRAGLDLQARGQDLNQGQNILQSLLAQRGQNVQMLLGRLGIDTTRMGNLGQQTLQQQQLTNQSNAGMGTTANALWQNYLNWKNSQPQANFNSSTDVSAI